MSWVGSWKWGGRSGGEDEVRGDKGGMVLGDMMRVVNGRHLY